MALETTDLLILERGTDKHKYPAGDLIDEILSRPPSPSAANKLVPRNVIDSRAGGLLTNGTGLLGDKDSVHAGGGKVMYNFDLSSAYTTEPETDGNLLDGVGMGFTTTGSHAFLGTSGQKQNEIMAVNPNSVYRGAGTCVPNQVSVDASQRLYVGHTFLDQNGGAITASQHQHFGFAKLAQALVLGTDNWLYIYRDDAIDPHTEWVIGDVRADNYSVRRGVCFWDHCHADQQVDGNGNSIPFTKASNVGNPDIPAGFGFTRHNVQDLWDNTAGLWEQADDGSGAGNWNGHTNVWRHPINAVGFSHQGHSYSANATLNNIPENTPCSHNWHGGTYKYTYCAGTIMAQPEKFMRYEGWCGGLDFSGKNKRHAFPPGTAGAVWMMLCNYGTSTLATQTHSALGFDPAPNVRLQEKIAGVLPEHVWYKLRLAEDNSSGTLVSTTIGVPRITYGVRPVV